MGLESAAHEIKTFLQSFHSLLYVETLDEGRLTNCLENVTSQLRLPLYQWSITQGLRHSQEQEALPRSHAAMDALTALEKLSGENVFLLKDFTPELEDRSVARKLFEIVQSFSKTHSTVILTGPEVKWPENLKRMLVYYKFQLPSTSEIALVVKNVVQSLRTSSGIEIDIDQPALNKLLGSLKGLSLNQIRQVVTQSILEDRKLSPQTLERVLEAKVKIISDGGLLEYFPPLDNPHQLGGFLKLKLWLERAKVGFSKEAKEMGLRAPKGILLLGVPGCGKSLSAKYCARAWDLPLLKIDFGRLFDKYLGETEKNFFRATEMAENLAPIVLWMDEIEKGLQTFNSAGDESGVSQRLFGSLLSWLQEKREDVFVVATANEIRGLPPELMRKGRFDEIFFVDLPSHEERIEIFKIHLSIRKQKCERFKLDELATYTDGFTGAEIEQAIVTALYEALYRKRDLTTEALLEECKNTKPLSHSRKEEIGALRNFVKDRFVSVN